MDKLEKTMYTMPKGLTNSGLYWAIDELEKLMKRRDLTQRENIFLKACKDEFANRTGENDRWHRVYGYSVYVERGKVLHATDDYETTYPYHKNRRGGWDNVTGELTLSAIRAGIRRGTIDFK